MFDYGSARGCSQQLAPCFLKCIDRFQNLATLTSFDKEGRSNEKLEELGQAGGKTCVLSLQGKMSKGNVLVSHDAIGRGKAI